MRIVLASPFPAEREALRQLLVDDGHELRTATDPDAGVEIATSWRPDVLIADSQVGNVGQALERLLRGRDLAVRVILLCPRAARCGGHPSVVCLTKPIDLERLRMCLAEPVRPVAEVA